MNGARVAQAIDDLTRNDRNDFEAFLVAWLVAELRNCDGTADVLTTVERAFDAFERVLGRVG